VGIFEILKTVLVLQTFLMTHKLFDVTDSIHEVRFQSQSMELPVG